MSIREVGFADLQADWSYASLPEKADRRVESKSAQIIFMVIICEIAFLAAVLPNEPGSWFRQIDGYRWLIVGLAVVFFCFACWQHCILFKIDREIVAHGKSGDDSTPTQKKP